LLKLDDCIGSLDEDKNADLVVVDGNAMEDVAARRPMEKFVASFSMGRPCLIVMRASSWLTRDFHLRETVRCSALVPKSIW
jgi:cytosine/adenosine deaminase-related metal-dependent hydrolase